ncbi:glycoside hydrolase family 38 C-terminal domain-containing protein [Paenibacillus sp. CF384]|uniref:alpha-mannosidase n=1 Tax=Paenibacillus sp. CF384 TaxID=1884382 RepID=UPI000895AA41|nr:glycoside hydrolase family 38 C-terminal domain-containing protein [Paenibacillus sp. CF384]SDX12767.1 mannosylglycerate hydrolase [Paenibacillus sp. CF384]
MEKKKMFLTPTTHWDREWVMTKGQFQVRLVNLIDRLLHILDEHPTYRFLLDGQAIVLEDYLAIKPEQRERIAALMESGRLVTGPWYVLADQFLENGESAIRNLLIGMDLIRQMRGRPMMLGYVPDSFGSIASLPMILNGFGIQYATFGRGRPRWDDKLAEYEFWWEGPAGSKVLAANHGYSHGIFLSYPDIWSDISQPSSLDPDAEMTLGSFLEEAQKQLDKAATPNLYMSVGIDHMEPRPSLPGIVDYINQHQEEYELKYAMPEDYLAAVAAAADGLSTYAGEMRGSDGLPMDLVGTLSSYMSLKQQNDASEILLQRLIEPLWVMASSASGANYPKGLIQNLWKVLLANHPHDSICGCSLDQVHKDMRNRFEEIENTGAYLIKDGLHQLIGAIDTASSDHNAIAVVVVNPLGRMHAGPVKRYVRVPKRFKHDAYLLVDEKGQTIPARIRHIVDKNKDLESEYMTADMLAVLISKTSEDTRADNQVFTVLEIVFIAEEVPATGYRTYWVKPAGMENEAESPSASLRLCEDGMENEAIRVLFHDDGTFDLLYKRTGRKYHNLNYFVDREETGDLYDHHEFAFYDERDSRTIGAKWQLHEQAPDRIVYRSEMNWALPEANVNGKRSSVQAEVSMTMYATLYAGIERLDFALDMNNSCKDHMLRVAFETGLHTQSVAAYDHFHVVDRSVRAAGGEWRDEPFQEFIDVSDGREGLCLSTKGLPAYEAVNGGDRGTTVQLTLVRSAGSVGQAAGANYPAPGGQCQGPHRFEYALIPHEGDWRQGECLGKASDYRTPLLVEATLQHDGNWPSCGSLFSFQSTGGKDLFMSCLKQAEDRSGWIARLWNPLQSGRVHVQSSLVDVDVCTALLDESLKEQVEDAAGEAIPMIAGELVTIKLQERIQGQEGER